MADDKYTTPKMALDEDKPPVSVSLQLESSTNWDEKDMRISGRWPSHEFKPVSKFNPVVVLPTLKSTLFPKNVSYPLAKHKRMMSELSALTQIKNLNEERDSNSHENDDALFIHDTTMEGSSLLNETVKVENGEYKTWKLDKIQSSGTFTHAPHSESDECFTQDTEKVQEDTKQNGKDKVIEVNTSDVLYIGGDEKATLLSDWTDSETKADAILTKQLLDCIGCKNIFVIEDSSTNVVPSDGKKRKPNLSGKQGNVTQSRRGDLQCDLCSNTYSYKAGLYRHRRKVHGMVGDEKYEKRPKSKECEYCGKTFKWRSLLVDHIKRIHTNERSVICHQCGRGFVSNTHLNEHLRWHERIKNRKVDKFKPFACTQCYRRCASRLRLQLHMDRSHGWNVTKTTKVRIGCNAPRIQISNGTQDENINIMENSAKNMNDSTVDFSKIVSSTYDADMKDTPQQCGFDSSNQQCVGTETHREDSEVVVPLTTGQKVETVFQITTKDIEDEKACPYCDKVFKGRYEYLRDHIVRVHDTHQCPVCQEICRSNYALMEHKHRVHSDKPPQYKCDQCDQAYYLATKLWFHKQTHHCLRIVCEVCGKDYKGKRQLQKHIRYMHRPRVTADSSQGEHQKSRSSKKHACDICNQRFASSQSMKYHLEKTHKKDQKLLCGLCDSTLGNNRMLRYHLYHKHGIGTDPETKNFQCNICNKVLSEGRKYIEHLQIHYDVKPYKCDACDMRFISKKRLQVHVNEKHSVDAKERMTCGVCNKVFSSQGSFRVHKKIHTGGKQYECHVCKRAFAYLHALKLHMALHSGEKPHKCEVCDAGYATKPSLKAHLKTHGQEVLDAYKEKERLKMKTPGYTQFIGNPGGAS